MENNNLKLSKDTFILLRNIIYEKSGIFFSENKTYLMESRLLKRLEENNCKNFEEYYNFLKYNTYSSKEFNSLFNSVTTNETSFFRDMPQLQAFEEIVLPNILNGETRKSTRKIKIWSAGCSTGEEPYTLAMIMMKRFNNLCQSQVEIFGSDISEDVLTSARKGIYKSYSFRNTPEENIKKYFDPLPDGNYMVKLDLKQLVKFAHINLYNPIQTKSIKDVDLVFCRNVIIYFDDEAKKKVISNIYDSLVKGGYLIIGHSESLHGISRAFKLITYNRSIVYQKG